VAQVTGLGGFFLRARDPEALSAWYATTLGLEFGAGSRAAILPETPGTYSVVAIFDYDSEYIGRPDAQSAMMNLRVDDLVGFVARLEAAGAHPEPVSDTEYGRFAWITDPEGNRVELWEPTLSL